MRVVLICMALPGADLKNRQKHRIGGGTTEGFLRRTGIKIVEKPLGVDRERTLA